MNKLTLTGKLTKDAEIRYVGDNKALTTLNIYETDEKTFLDITCWEEVAESVSNFHKDELININGYIKKRSYDDKNTGKKVYVTEIFALNVSGCEPENDEVKPSDFMDNNDQAFADFGETVELNEDDIAF